MTRRLGLVVLALAACLSDHPTEPHRPSFAITSPVLTLAAAGDIARCGSTTQDSATGLTVQGIIDRFPNTTVAALGDLAYETGTDAEFQCFHQVWGGFKPRIRPAVGNHEYETTGAAGYFNYFGSAAGDRTKGYYSYDIGTWHIVVINTNSLYVPTKPGSAQDTWLVADLAANTKPCILAYMHHWRFASQVNQTTIPPLDGVTSTPWERLYQAGADLMLVGHSHRRERFYPLTPAGVRDDARGIRQIIVGTGGDSQGTGYKAIHPMSVVRSPGGVYGVEQVTLGTNNYTSVFRPIAGQTWTDSISASCHGSTAATPPPSPIVLSLTARQDSTKQYMTLTWTGARGTTVDVYRDGAFHINTLNDGRYTNSVPLPGATTYTYKLCETGTTICSNSASVTFGGGTSPPPNTPPNSSFTVTCTGLNCSFKDTSKDADGSVTGWSWTFGDGGTSTAQNPTHTYATESPYTVTLVAKDNANAPGNTFTQTVTVTNTPPSSSFTVTCTGLDCSFKDTSSDGDGSVTGWSWTFGDNGTSTVQNPTHTYATDGPYTVTLVATDNVNAPGNTFTQTVTVTPPPPNTPPSTSFTVTCTNLQCSFKDSSSDLDGSVTGWSWTFGDNGTSTVQNPTHTYAVEGSYPVTLVATDNANAPGNTFTQTVTVTPPPPNTPPTASFTSSCTDLTCTFTDGSTDVAPGTVTAWSWTFGDGATSTVRNPSHSYAAAITYTVSLTVTDDQGATNQRSATVTVTKPPAPTIVLKLTGRQDATTQYMTLDWTGARGTTVDVYRNGAFHINTLNDGHYTNSRPFTGAITYTYKVCETGTTVCSNSASVTFP